MSEIRTARIGHLLRLHLVVAHRSYLILLAVAGGIMALMMSVTLRVNDVYSQTFINWGAFYVGMFVVGSYASSTMFRAYATPQRGMAQLMLPASTAEKFGVLAAVNLALLLVIGLLFLLLRAYFRFRLDLPDAGFQPEELVGDSPSAWRWWLLLSVLVNQGIFFLGAIVFPRKSFLKTVGILIGLSFLSGYFFSAVGQLVLDKQVTDPTPDPWLFAPAQADVRLVLGSLLLMALWLGTWAVAYWRLRRKQF